MMGLVEEMAMESGALLDRKDCAAAGRPLKTGAGGCRSRVAPL
jgi:hypothetical protein